MITSTNSRLKGYDAQPVYRPDIDGLRAVAVLSVVLFHAFPSRFQAGFVGVDIFFVISGFLISSIIFRSLQIGSFSFVEFYAHRARRIFPALILVLVSTYCFGWITLFPDEFKQLGKHIAASAGFIQNFALWKEVGYFDTAAELKPLLHLWSLAIEEQFYLIYPMLIYVVWRIGRNNTLGAITLLGVLSFYLNIKGVTKDLSKTFFLPHTRYWELFSGALLASMQNLEGFENIPLLSRKTSHSVLLEHAATWKKLRSATYGAISVVGLALIVGALTFIAKSTPFPGWWAVLPVIGTVCVISAGSDALINRFVLSSRLLVSIGLISYPLYLWHWPILSFARIIESGVPSRTIRIGAIILSFVLAWLTCLFVEKPIRFGKKKRIKTALLPVVLLIIGYVGYNAYMRDGLRFRAIAKDSAQRSLDLQEYQQEVCNSKEFGKLDLSWCNRSKNENNVDFALWGDSHAEHLYPGVKKVFEQNWMVIGRHSCPPLLGVKFWVDGDNPETCKGANDSSLKEILKSNAPIVVLASLGPLYLDGKGVAPEHAVFDGEAIGYNFESNDGLTDKREIFQAGLQSSVDALVEAGKKVVIVKDVPEFPMSPKSCLGRPFSSTSKNCDLPTHDFMKRNAAYHQLLREIERSSNRVYIFDAASLFCSDVTCKSSDSQHVYYRDGHHLSVAGSMKVALALKEFLEKLSEK